MLAPANRTFTLSGGKVYAGQVAPSIQPAWLSAMTALNEWHPISGTSGAGGAAIDAYSGWAKVGTKLVSACSGGHSDSSDNRVTSIDLSADAPAWTLRMAASTSVAPDTAYYPDGKPTSRHIYHMAKYLPTLDRVMLFGGHFTYTLTSTGDTFATDGFNLNSNTWDTAGTYPNAPMISGGSVVDGNGDAWVHSFGSTVWKFTAATKTWSQPLTTTYGPYGPRFPWALDTARNQLFGIQFGDGQGYNPELGIIAVKQVGNVQSAVTFNASAGRSAFIADAPALGGMDYDSVNDFFLFNAGYPAGNMYKIIPNSGNVWDIQVFVYGSGNVAPAQSTAGTLSRFSYIPDLKGFVLLPRKTDNLLFLRTA